MKSERRHELQHNELADWMTNVIEKTKPYANVILGGVLLVAIVAVGWSWMARQSRDEAAQAWEDFYDALASRSFTDLNGVAEHYPGSDAARWAKVVVGDLRLAEGCDELFTSRAGANQELEKARECYDDVLAECSDPAIRQRAAFGLARAWEAQGKLDKAAECYKQALVPEGAYALMAKARIAALADPATKRFYDEFAQFDPKPAYRQGPIEPLDLDKFKNLDVPSPGTLLFPEGGSLTPPTEPSKKSGETEQSQPATPPAAKDEPPKEK